MLAAGRLLRIRELLALREFVDLATLCRELDSSESSVRRDWPYSSVTRVHGGALAMSTANHALDLSWQRTRNAPEKRRIAAAAAALIVDDQTVILDGGSTVAMVAEELTGKSLRVITNSLAIAECSRTRGRST